MQQLSSGSPVGAQQRQKINPNPFYKNVYSPKNLRKAWATVLENGRTSKCKKTRDEIDLFKQTAESNLGRINRLLRQEKFFFPQSMGIPIKRQGKAPRPLVVSPIVSRIVQRAILDVLQAETALESYYKIPTSFGGIKGKGLGVPGAVKAAYSSIRNGVQYFIRSDIEGFFKNIPRDFVLEKIKNVINDQKFNALLQKAVQTELENLVELGKQADAFPIYEVGVAQGCCLSPLLGNILLEEFDRKLNDRGILCLRYIDDFIILGPDKKKVFATFESAKRILAGFNLTAYDPLKDNGKAEHGEVKRGIEFLGCEIRPGEIRPNRKSKKRLLKSIEDILTKSMKAMHQPKHLVNKKLTLIETLTAASNVIEGWGNQYSFCNDPVGFQNLDGNIDDLISGYWKVYSKNQTRWNMINDRVSSRRLLGVHVLEKDSKHDPIIKK